MCALSNPRFGRSRFSAVRRAVLIVLVVSVFVSLCLILYDTVASRGALRDAAAEGDLNRLGKVLDSRAGRADLHSTNRYGYGPMHLAAQYGHYDALKLLLERGGDVNARKPSSLNTPLIMAASRGHVDCCNLLLDKGADAAAYGLFGGTRHTALQCAAGAGHLAVVNLFLARGIGPNEKEGTASALHSACKENRIDVVRTLVTAGADVTSMQEWYWNTPLQLAVKYEHSEIAAFLREAVATEEERQREIERLQFDAILASVRKDSKELVVEAYIPISARFVVDSNGMHWESRAGGKPGTNFGQKRNDPTYINGVAWYPRWSTGIHEKALDKSEPCPVRIPSIETARFELLGVGESRDSYTIKACPRIKSFLYQDREFAIVLTGTEIHFRWCRFRLSW